jgi:hypothetical protein
MRKYHTNTTTGHVGGDHDRALSSLELVQNPITLVLLLVSVDSKTGPAILTEESSDLVGGALGAGEDQAFALLVVHDLFEVLDQAVALYNVS